MALEHRNGRVYAYRSERVGNTVRKQYLGAGAIALAADRLFTATRELKRLDRLDATGCELAQERKLANFRKWFKRINGVVAEALIGSGWHQHHRGEWRRKRGATMSTLAPTAPLPWHGPTLGRAAGSLDPATTEKAGKGDRSVVPAVEAFLNGNPAAVTLWGDMGRRVLQRWVSRYAGSCVTTERAVLTFAAELRDRLMGPNPDPLVQLVSERVVISWVALNYYESLYATQHDQLIMAQHKFHVARIELANRNLMSACRTLAKVKRAKLPDVVALVNVASPSIPAK